MKDIKVYLDSYKVFYPTEYLLKLEDRVDSINENSISYINPYIL